MSPTLYDDVFLGVLRLDRLSGGDMSLSLSLDGVCVCVGNT